MLTVFNGTRNESFNINVYSVIGATLIIFPTSDLESSIKILFYLKNILNGMNLVVSNLECLFCCLETLFGNYEYKCFCPLFQSLFSCSFRVFLMLNIWSVIFLYY